MANNKRRAADWMTGGDAEERVRKQMRFAEGEYDMSAAPSRRGPIAIPQDSTEVKKVGTNQRFAHLAHMAPEWRGVDPSATTINKHGVLNPRRAVGNPASKYNVRISVQDGGELTTDENANSAVHVTIQALLLNKEKQLTWQAVGVSQFLFSRLPDRTHLQSFRYQPETLNEAKVASPGVLNAILEAGGENWDGKHSAGQEYSASRPQTMLNDWRP